MCFHGFQSSISSWNFIFFSNVAMNYMKQVSNLRERARESGLLGMIDLVITSPLLRYQSRLIFLFFSVPKEPFHVWLKKKKGWL